MQNEMAGAFRSTLVSVPSSGSRNDLGSSRPPVGLIYLRNPKKSSGNALGRRRTRKRWLLVSFISMSLLMLFLASCTSSTSLTGSDNGKTIQAHVGDEINIALDSNPTTGYSWAIEKSDATLLTLKQSDFSASNGSIGSGGTQTLTFVAKSAGTVNLQLKYWRSFAGDKSITRRFAVTIQIQA